VESGRVKERDREPWMGETGGGVLKKREAREKGQRNNLSHNKRVLKKRRILRSKKG